MQERVVREIRTLRAKRRGLETELRQAGLRRRGAKAAAWPPDAYCHRASPRPYRVPAVLPEASIDDGE